MPDLTGGVVTVVALPARAPTVGARPPAPPTAVVLPVPGPPGPPGLAASQTFTHVQDTPAASWLITHPAHRPVTALTVLVDGDEVLADVAHSGTTATVTFATPVAGVARYV